MGFVPRRISGNTQPKVCLKTHEELEQQTIMFIENVRLAASHATPVLKYQTASGIKYPAEIR